VVAAAGWGIGRRAVVAAALGAAVALALAAGPAARPAHACSCAATTEAEAFARADVVFRGEVVGHDPGDPSSTATPTWTFAVSEVYKGEVAATQEVVSDSWSCGLEIPERGVFLVFARDDGPLRADLCGGTRSIAAGPLAVDVVATAPRASVDGGWDEARGRVVAVLVAGLVVVGALGAGVRLSRRRR
jgi:hypothetical protein